MRLSRSDVTRKQTPEETSGLQSKQDLDMELKVGNMSFRFLEKQT